MMDCFYNEVAVMIKVSLEGHQNVITLVGCIPELPYPAIIMEYAPLGNLHGFLLKYKNQVRVWHARKIDCSLFHVTIVLFTPFEMQHLPAMVSDTVIMPPVTQVASEFQSYYNTLTLEPQDVLLFGCQIASGMVSKDIASGMNTLSQVSSTYFSLNRSSWPG